jgi:hypothetical protein
MDGPPHERAWACKIVQDLSDVVIKDHRFAMFGRRLAYIAWIS